MPKPLRYHKRLERFPPILIRLLVTRGRGKDRWVPDDRQLANACGLSMAEFKFVSYSTNWDDVGAKLQRAFLMGCDIDLEHRDTFNRISKMRSQGKFAHLRNDPNWEQYRQMIELWAESAS